MVEQIRFFCDPDELDTRLLELFKSLYTLFKSYFIDDKYLYLFESLLELDGEQLGYIENLVLPQMPDFKVQHLNMFLI